MSVENNFTTRHQESATHAKWTIILMREENVPIATLLWIISLKTDSAFILLNGKVISWTMENACIAMRARVTGWWRMNASTVENRAASTVWVESARNAMKDLIISRCRADAKSAQSTTVFTVQHTVNDEQRNYFLNNGTCTLCTLAGCLDCLNANTC